MDELIRWTDDAPSLRRFDILFDATRPRSWRVRVWTMTYQGGGPVVTGDQGEGEGHSLNFAAVRALIAFDELRGVT